MASQQLSNRREKGSGPGGSPGFRMPAEWAAHDATWCSWPRNQETWPHNLAAVRREFTELVRAIAADEPVRVMAGAGPDADSASVALGDIRQVEIVDIQTNDAWARDYAPTFVRDLAGRIAAVDWIYNAWGGKYPPFDDDQQVARRVAERIGCEHQPVDLCLEGGALEIDADGLLMCTRTCAFDPNRNPGLAEDEIERRISGATGASAMIWLSGDCLIGDDTDGHIDQLARFTPAGPILLAWTDDESDSQHAGLSQNRKDLMDGLARLNRRVDLVPLPLPDPVFFRGVQIPACYCNYYLTNRSVIVPAFGVRQDETAAKLVGALHPGRTVVVLPSTNLTVGLGSFHCLTQQQPAAEGEGQAGRRSGGQKD